MHSLPATVLVAAVTLVVLFSCPHQVRAYSCQHDHVIAGYAQLFLHLFLHAWDMAQALTPIRFKETWVSTTQSYDGSPTHLKRQSGSCGFRFFIFSSHVFLRPC